MVLQAVYSGRRKKIILKKKKEFSYQVDIRK